MQLTEVISDFQTPASQFRGAPFWAWNGKLEPEDLRRQVRHMHRMGLGGFFMHSRVGLDTPYLSDEWMDCIDACADEADKLGMRAWLYDEDRWPSGAAGGLVTKTPEYRQRFLCMYRYNSEVPQNAISQDVLAVFKVTLQNDVITAKEELDPNSDTIAPQDGEAILVFRIEKASPSSWYNGYTYLDTMNHDAVAEFIRVTHEKYAQEEGKHFQKSIPGIFTDEPNHGHKYKKYTDDNGVEVISLPWTQRLPEIFRQRYSYDLLAYLPELFFDSVEDDACVARYHYNDCTTFLFVDAFARQIGEWCERNGVEHTGHVLAEETLSSQNRVVGSCMRFYPYMQAPGMDLLTQFRREYDTAKQVSSVARQFGRKWRLTETYGCTGWDFPFEGHKALGDWQAALGINLRCQHLSWYTMKGQAKRDYPASIFYQSPWWQHYNKVEDYFARINAVMTRGVEIRHVLVVHPVESLWVQPMDSSQQSLTTEELESSIMQLRDNLLAANIDFDYGDEDIMANHATVKSDQSGPCFQVEEAPYRAAVLPPMTNIRSSTLNLLQKFMEEGGTVICCHTPPERVDGKLSDYAQEVLADCPVKPCADSDLPDALSAHRAVSVTDPDGSQLRPTLQLLREDDEAAYLFVCNTGRDFFADGEEAHLWDKHISERTDVFTDVRIRGYENFSGHPLELDPDTGELYQATAEKIDSGWEIKTSLHKLGSRLFITPRENVDVDIKSPSRDQEEKREVQQLEADNWEYTLSEPNVLVLDRPAFKIGGNDWQLPQEILRVDAQIHEALDIPRRGGRMTQPWAQEHSGECKSTPVELCYTFEVEEVPRLPIYLAIEEPGTFAIEINVGSIRPANRAGAPFLFAQCGSLSLAAFCPDDHDRTCAGDQPGPE